MNRPLQRDVVAERMLNGGWLLSIVHDGYRRQARYFEFSLREAKRRFIADIVAGAL